MLNVIAHFRPGVTLSNILCKMCHNKLIDARPIIIKLRANGCNNSQHGSCWPTIPGEGGTALYGLYRYVPL